MRRTLPDAPAGLAVLPLDAHVLAYAHDLEDVRLVDARGRQIPYVVEQRAEPLVVALKLSPPRTEKKASVYAFEVPYARLPSPVLVLKTNAHVFERGVIVRTAGQSHRRNRVLAAGAWRSADPATIAPALRLEFRRSPSRSLELVVDEGDNAPLPITSAQLQLPASALRFEHPGGRVDLLYGNARARAPRYDLTLLGAKLRQQKARELRLGTPPAAVEEPDDQERRWFWIAMIVAAVVLIGVLIRVLLVNAETSHAPRDSTS